MKKTVEIILSKEAQKTFIKLMQKSEKKKIERTIFNAILRKTELIKKNPHVGNPVSKKLIPFEYKENYEIKNLFRIELPNYRRMLYTLTNEEKIKIIAFVIEIINHKEYDKRFDYKKI